MFRLTVRHTVLPCASAADLEGIVVCVIHVEIGD